MAKSSSLFKTTAGTLVLLSFFLLGAWLFVWQGLRPLWKLLTTARWNEVACTIHSAEVEAYEDAELETTHRVKVAYTYQVQGVEYHGARYSLSSESKNFGLDGMRAEAERLTRQPNQRCWVDPSDAKSAVLVRNVGAAPWFSLLFGAVLLVVGSIGLLIVMVPLLLVLGWARAGVGRLRRALGRSPRDRGVR